MNNSLTFAMHPRTVIKVDKHPEDTRELAGEDFREDYIGYNKMIQMYGIPYRHCVLWDEKRPETFEGRNWDDYVHLYPVEGDMKDYKAALDDAMNKK